MGNCWAQQAVVPTPTSSASAYHGVWRSRPDPEQAKKEFYNDGTLDADNFTPGHLELRQLLSEPVGQRYIGAHAKETLTQETFFCWVDIQEYKSIPTADFQKSKAWHIYHKYISEGAVLQLGMLTAAERQQVLQLLRDAEQDPHLLNVHSLDHIQRKCFAEIYHSFTSLRNSPKFEDMKRDLRQNYNRVGVDDFQYMGKLGEGGFGVVVHVVKRSTGRHYAMKIQSKHSLIETYYDDPRRVVMEKSTLVTCNHPFIVNLDYSFQTQSLAIMILTLAGAGDLHRALQASPTRRLEQHLVQFYMAEVVLALAHLHDLGLMYRDLKPSNILLDTDGHIKLVDMGGCADGDNVVVTDQLGSLDSSIFQSKVTRSVSYVNPEDAARAALQLSTSGNQSDQFRRTSIMGTLGYMAPEVVVMMTQGRRERLGYTKAVDMWSLGITIYKLLTGKKPFDKSCMENLIEYSMNHPYGALHNKEYAALFGPIQFPDYVSLEARDLVSRLLDQNERTRLGVMSVSEVKGHPFFRGIEWNKLEQKHVIPPVIPAPPKLDSKPQWPNFNAMLKQLGSPDWTIVPEANEQAHFDDWDYISPQTLKIEMGIAREMDVYDSNFKVRQVLGTIDTRRTSWLFN